MKLNYLVSLTFFSVLSGCSFYDVATIATDAAFGTGLFSDEDENNGEWNGLWNPETSECIKHEKEWREISQRLEATDDGQTIVTLPTGEKYSLIREAGGNNPPVGPTETCLSRHSE